MPSHPRYPQDEQPLEERLAAISGGWWRWLYLTFLAVIATAISVALIVAGVTGGGERDACFGAAVFTVPVAGLLGYLSWKTRMLAPGGKMPD